MPQQFIKSWDEVPLYIDPVYIANILGVTEETIRKYIRRGDLKSVCIGNTHRIAKQDARSFIEGLPKKSPSGGGRKRA